MTHSPDSLALLLLCSHLALPRERGEELRVLSPSEQAKLRYGLGGEGFAGAGGLLGLNAGEIASTLAVDEPFAARLAALLARGGQLALALEELASLGIWASTRVDETYPRVLQERLGNSAPPVLFGAGPVELLGRPGVGVVGSRDLDPAGAAFAREVGAVAAQQGLALVSGAAKGADRMAMLAALEEDGTSVGIPADSLRRLMSDREFGGHVRRGRLALATPFHPAAGFDVKRAMARNKLIYCLAGAVYIAASGVETGGTWTGAVEALNAGWAPVFARSGDGVPDGNRELIRLGARPTTLESVRSGVALIPDGETTEPPPPVGFDDTEGDVTWERVTPFLAEWRSPAEVAQAFGVSEAWSRRQLKDAAARGMVAEKRNRYRVTAQATLPAFDDIP